MTDVELIAEARALAARATPGPWEWEAGTAIASVYDAGGDVLADFLDDARRDDDAVFVARTRTLLPALADALERAHVAVLEYGHHLPSCPQPSRGPCDCGWEEIAGLIRSRGAP